MLGPPDGPRTHRSEAETAPDALKELKRHQDVPQAAAGIVLCLQQNRDNKQSALG